ncbi:MULTISPECIES: pitrilysin family protein [Corallococcus]|uniref:M16 family metallopeptidase n=1 Tax=Corallococcus TaxID=83461 RepID=UPI001180F3FF|nr:MULTISPECIES: pitrilysin family protein [Corallococcus]NBD07613.1 insulinase family protein [Corallococcus silvisoli]TSC33617.1 insulinase family protein [Corallococcus sp. Z5C101001]
MPIRYSLPNGLTVVFEEQHAAKVAAFQVWVKAGSADERPDQAGLAHLHEHMLFKGTERRGPGEIARDIEAHGGEINAWTSFDQTVYHIVIASQFARTGLDILGDAVRRSAFDKDELAREIEVVCEEIKRSFDSPARRSSRGLFTAAFQTHPYRLPVIGTEESVRGFTREKVLEFYHRHYTPQNLVLVVVGDLTEAQLRPWVEEIFGGDWGRPYAGPVSRPRDAAPTARRVLVQTEDVKEAYLNLAFSIPELEHPDVPALDVLAMIAGQGNSSWLVREVKRRQHLVNDVHASAYTPKDPGIFSVSLTLPPAQAQKALTQTARVLEALRTTRVSEDELRTVKAVVEAESVYRKETVQGTARNLGSYQTSPGGLESEARYLEHIRNLTPEDLRRVAEKYLRLEHAIATALVPPSAALTEAEVHAALDEAARSPGLTPPERAARQPPPEAPARPARSTTGSARTEVVQEKLPSGATLIVRVEPHVPLVSMRAAFIGGVRYETPADNGITTLLSRTLTKGTTSLSADDISHLEDLYAGNVSGQGGRNSVSLKADFLARYFEPGFRLFADCLLNPAFREEEVARERSLLLQDILTREDKPSGLAFELFSRTLYQEHPYRLSLTGEKASVEALGPEQLRAYHRAHMDPSQLTLSVVGDVRVDEVRALAREFFGQSRGGAVAPKQVRPEAPPSSPRVEKKTLARAQTHLVMGFQAARLTDRWRIALDVLSTVLSGQGGRLFVELRDKRSMAYSVSSFSMDGLDPGYFAVYMGTSPEKVDAAVEGMRRELERIRDEPIPAAELERAKQHIIGAYEIDLQRNSARATLLALDTCYGVGLDNFLHYSEHVAKVTAEEIQEVARRVIDFDRMAMAVVGP